MIKTSTIVSGLLLSMAWLNPSYASNTSLSVLEQQLYNKYAKQDFYSINQQVETDVVELIEKNADSYAYLFSKLTPTLGLTIHYSPDQLFKTYTFDVGGGGTMGEYSSYAQLKNNAQNKLQAFEAGFIRSVDQVTLSGQPIYLIQSYYKGDSCVGSYQIQAYIKQNKQLSPVAIFQTKSKKLDKINVDYDCHDDAKREGNYIRVAKDMKFIDIKLLDQKSKPTGRYLRYQKNKKNYQYIGTVK